MKTRYLLLLLSQLFFVPSISYSQFLGDNDLLQPKERTIEIPTSPEVAQFEKYGGFSNNLYTGTPEISIPIFGHQGKETGINISLTYDASGIKVDQYATNVGLGWNLNFGGVVSRVTNHLPDDLIYEQGVGSGAHYYKIYENITRGFIHDFNNNGINFLFGDYYQLPLINTLQEADNMLDYVWDFYYNLYRKNKIDTEPDTFSYSVNGLSGKIMIDYDNVDALGNYLAYCTKNPDVKVKAYWENTQGGSLKHIDKWEITDGSGTKYVFEKKELNKTIVDEAEVHIQREFVTAWYLTEIKSLNNLDHYTFQYSPGMYFEEQEILTNKNKFAYTRIVHGCGYMPPENPVISDPYGPLINETLQFHLEEIKLDEYVIFSTEVDNRDDNPVNKRYTKFKVHNPLDNTDIVNNIELNQSYFTHTLGQSQNDIYNSRLKLDGLIIYNEDKPNGKEYAFTYFNPNEMPKTNSAAVDYWGYYNGKNNQTMIEHHPGGYTSGSANKNPDFNFAKYGTLESIYYPTGGKTTFYYEPHYVSGHPSFVKNGVVGGLRLEKQISYTLDDDGPRSVTKKYFYNDLKEILTKVPRRPSSIPPGAAYISSGKAHQPLNFIDTKLGSHFQQNPEGVCEEYTYTTLFQFSQNKAQAAPYPVTYSKVSEIEFNGIEFNGYTFYEYHNEYYNVSGKAQDVPYFDSEPLNGKLIKNTVYNSAYQTLKISETTYNQIVINDEIKVRGIIPVEGLQHSYICVFKGEVNTTGHFYQKGKTIFESPGVFCSGGGGPTIQCSYDLCVQNNSKTQLHRGTISEYSFVNYSYPSYYVLLEQTRTIEHFNQNPVETTAFYNYDSQPNHYYVTSIENILNSGGETITTELVYPQDLIDFTSPEEDHQNLVDLVNHNYVSSPLKVLSYRNEELLGLQRVFFRDHGKLKSHISTTKSDFDLEEKVVYHQYDNYGNPQILSFNGAPNTFYIWGYNNRYLVGKIENLPNPSGGQFVPSNALTIINNIKDESNNLNGTEQDMIDLFEELKDALPESEITTITHLPGIGVSSISDSKKDILFYEYDLNNRLERILDQNRYIIEEFEYNYRPIVFIEEPIQPAPYNFSIQSEILPGNQYKFTAVLTSGGGGTFQYDWGIVQGGTAVGPTTSSDFMVSYDCPTNPNHTGELLVYCDIYDDTYPEGITRFKLESIVCPDPVSATGLTVTESRGIPDGSSTSEFYGLYLEVDGLQGGSDHLKFDWYYKIGNGAYIHLVNEETEYGNHSITPFNFLNYKYQGVVTATMNAICGQQDVTFKCVITDFFLPGYEETVNSGSISINCSANPQ